MVADIDYLIKLWKAAPATLPAGTKREAAQFYEAVYRSLPELVNAVGIAVRSRKLLDEKDKELRDLRDKIRGLR